MRRTLYFVMALALVLGFTQCKKEQPTPQTQGVRITLTVDGGNSNSRVIVDPTGHNDPDYATVSFEDGDVIYVGYKVGESNKCVGTLTYSSSNSEFSGNVDIEDIVENEHLHFYFLGGVGFTPTVNDASTEASVVISNQAVKYPVISYAPSKQSYTGSGTYSAKLMNKCSIMKFNVTKPAESISAICITGMNNKVTVHFDTPNADDNGFSYSKDGSGQIMMKGGSGASIETWAIVLPQEALVAGGAGSAYINYYNGTRPAIKGLSENDAIGSNQYLSDATDRTITIDSQTTGMLVGEFSISASQKVRFSQGNLQSSTTNSGSWSNPVTTTTWSFAANQWTVVGENQRKSQRDLFCWGTGDNPENTASYLDYSTFHEWGVNAISNGGNVENYGWRTLSSSEWEYIINSRTTSTVNSIENARFAKAYLFGTDHGLILFPDNYIHPDGVAAPTGINATDNTSWNANQYSSTDWAKMEAVGAVFLPTAGYDYNSNGYGIEVYDVGSQGVYWTSTPDETDTRYSYMMTFTNEEFGVSYGGRAFGFSVRLVKEVQ